MLVLRMAQSLIRQVWAVLVLRTWAILYRLCRVPARRQTQRVQDPCELLPLMTQDGSHSKLRAILQVCGQFLLGCDLARVISGGLGA